MLRGVYPGTRNTTDEGNTKMANLVISENVTLDGVMQDPTGDDGFLRGGWFSRVAEEDLQAWAEVECEEALRAQALLMGRRATSTWSRVGPAAPASGPTG